MRIALAVLVSAAILCESSLAQVTATSDSYISKTAYDACVAYGDEYGISPELIMAVIWAESRGVPDAENGGCCGLMQINVRWHMDRMERLGVDDIFDERGNILIGTDLLAELFKEYGDVAYALDVYHGDRSAKRNYESRKLSEYAKKILERSEELERLHGK